MNNQINQIQLGDDMFLVFIGSGRDEIYRKLEIIAMEVEGILDRMDESDSMVIEERAPKMARALKKLSLN